MDEEKVFPASEETPGQAESRSAYQSFLEDGKWTYDWWLDYQEIKGKFPHFRNWRIWVYIAWAGSPFDSREPATEEELARDVLGCTDRAVRNWKQREWKDEEGRWLPSIEEAIAWTQAAPLLQHRRDVFEALVDVACKSDFRAHQDRKLFLMMTGDFNPKAEQIHSGQVEVVGMSIEEWRKEQERRQQEVEETLAMFDDDDDGMNEATED